MWYHRNLTQLFLAISLMFIERSLGLPAYNGDFFAVGHHSITQATEIPSSHEFMGNTHVPSLVKLDTATVQMNQQKKDALQLRNLPKPQIDPEEHKTGNPRRELRPGGARASGSCSCGGGGGASHRGGGSWNTPKSIEILTWLLYSSYQLVFHGRMIWIVHWVWRVVLLIYFSRTIPIFFHLNITRWKIYQGMVGKEACKWNLFTYFFTHRKHPFGKDNDRGAYKSNLSFDIFQTG